LRRGRGPSGKASPLARGHHARKATTWPQVSWRGLPGLSSFGRLAVTLGLGGRLLRHEPESHLLSGRDSRQLLRPPKVRCCLCPVGRERRTPGLLGFIWFRGICHGAVQARPCVCHPFEGHRPRLRRIAEGPPAIPLEVGRELFIRGQAQEHRFEKMIVLCASCHRLKGEAALGPASVWDGAPHRPGAFQHVDRVQPPSS